MEARIAKVISYVFHPLLMPLVGVFVIFQLNSYITIAIAPLEKWLVYFMVATLTCIIPTLLVLFLYWRNALSSLHMPERKERILPFFMATMFYFVTYVVLKRLDLPQQVNSALLASAIAVLCAFIINFFWKISIHMIGIAGVAGAIFGIGNILMTEILTFLIPFVVLTGLVAFSRLKLNAHTTKEVYAGAALGFFLEYAIVYLELG